MPLFVGGSTVNVFLEVAGLDRKELKARKEIRMKKTAISLVLALCLVWPCSDSSGESQEKMEALPDLILTVPDNDYYKSYLGLTGKIGDTFKAADGPPLV